MGSTEATRVIVPNFELMPKVELHLHLEGAIPLDALWTLVSRRGASSGVSSPDDLRARFAYRDFAHFIEMWTWKNQFLDSYEAFTFAAERVAAGLADQRIVYAEMYFSPSDFAGHGLEPGALALAIRTGLDAVAGTSVSLIVDVVRDTGPERAARTLDAVADVAADAGVIGVTIGGLEAEYPAEQFADVFAAARERGLRLTAHAGEAAGPESVRAAVDVLGVERIGHGVRAVEDMGLLDRLVSSQIPLEVCPTSNVRTGVVARWEDHPVRKLIEAGANVTLNSDDPVMFDCTLAGEYRALQTHLGISDEVLRRLAVNAVTASWAPSGQAAELRERLDDWWEESGSGNGGE